MQADGSLVVIALKARKVINATRAVNAGIECSKKGIANYKSGQKFVIFGGKEYLQNSRPLCHGLSVAGRTKKVPNYNYF